MRKWRLIPAGDGETIEQCWQRRRSTSHVIQTTNVCDCLQLPIDWTLDVGAIFSSTGSICLPNSQLFYCFTTFPVSSTIYCRLFTISLNLSLIPIWMSIFSLLLLLWFKQFLYLWNHVQVIWRKKNCSENSTGKGSVRRGSTAH